MFGERSPSSSTRDNQTRLYLGSSALWLAANAEGIIPSNEDRHIFFGASAGEYAALMAAGAYDFETGLRLIDVRGQEMQKASIINPGEMLVASGISFEDAKKLEKDFPGVYAVNDNPGTQTVFSGSIAGIRALGNYLSEHSQAKLHWPDIPEAAHSWHMKPAIEGVKNAVRKAKIKKPTHDFIGNQAKALGSPQAIRRHLAAQLTRGVLLRESARVMRDEYGVETFIDVGPGNVLYVQMKRQFRKSVKLISVVDELMPEK